VPPPLPTPRRYGFRPAPAHREADASGSAPGVLPPDQVRANGALSISDNCSGFAALTASFAFAACSPPPRAGVRGALLLASSTPRSLLNGVRAPWVLVLRYESNPVSIPLLHGLSGIGCSRGARWVWRCADRAAAVGDPDPAGSAYNGARRAARGAGRGRAAWAFAAHFDPFRRSPRYPAPGRVRPRFRSATTSPRCARSGGSTAPPPARREPARVLCGGSPSRRNPIQPDVLAPRPARGSASARARVGRVWSVHRVSDDCR
jgi:hypothetical protein